MTGRVDMMGEVISAVDGISEDTFCVEDVLLKIRRSYNSAGMVRTVLNGLIREGTLFPVTEFQVGRSGRAKERWSKTPKPVVTEEEALDNHIASILPLLEHKFSIGHVLVAAGLSRGYYTRVRFSLNRLSQRGVCHRYLLVDEDDIHAGRPVMMWTADPYYMELSRSFVSKPNPEASSGQ